MLQKVRTICNRYRAIKMFAINIFRANRVSHYIHATNFEYLSNHSYTLRKKLLSTNKKYSSKKQNAHSLANSNVRIIPAEKNCLHCILFFWHTWKKMVWLEYLKIYLDTDMKIILLDYQNNYVERSKHNEQCYKKFSISRAFYIFIF